MPISSRGGSRGRHPGGLRENEPPHGGAGAREEVSPVRSATAEVVKPAPRLVQALIRPAPTRGVRDECVFVRTRDGGSSGNCPGEGFVGQTPGATKRSSLSGCTGAAR